LGGGGAADPKTARGRGGRRIPPTPPSIAPLVDELAGESDRFEDLGAEGADLRVVRDRHLSGGGGGDPPWQRSPSSRVEE